MSSITRPAPIYSNFFCVPRFSSSSFRISPMYSSWVITVASIIGSSISLCPKDLEISKDY